MIRAVTSLARLLAGPTVPCRVPLPPGAEVRRSRLITVLGGFFAGMSGPARGVTLGRVIVLAPNAEADDRLIRHELAHVEQWEREPFAFPFHYIAEHIRRGYAGNRYEAEARAAERGSMTGDRT